MLIETLYCLWWRHRYYPKREAALNADPEWVAVRAVEAEAEDPAQRFDAMARRSEIGDGVMTLDPWWWSCIEYHGQCFWLYRVRAPRRDYFAGIPRAFVGEHLWDWAARPICWVAGTVKWVSGLRCDDFADLTLTWGEWLEILTDNDDPPPRCLQFATGALPEGCRPDCAVRSRGKVRCLKPRPDSLSRILANHHKPA